jgi:acyl-coenzyme A thioesterase PaaI-like protein
MDQSRATTTGSEEKVHGGVAITMGQLISVNYEVNFDLAVFTIIPWCAKLLEGPDIVVDSRESNPSAKDGLFAKTLNTHESIRALLPFYKREDKSKRVDEVYALLSLGDGVNGYPGLAHGGIVSAMVDEVMGILTTINKERKSMPEGDIMTAYLNVKYRKPVATPQTVLVSARFRKVEDRKYFIDGMVKDGFGTILTTAEALWIQPKLSGKL